MNLVLLEQIAGALFRLAPYAFETLQEAKPLAAQFITHIKDEKTSPEEAAALHDTIDALTADVLEE